MTRLVTFVTDPGTEPRLEQFDADDLRPAPLPAAHPDTACKRCGSWESVAQPDGWHCDACGARLTPAPLPFTCGRCGAGHSGYHVCPDRLTVSVTSQPAPLPAAVAVAVGDAITLLRNHGANYAHSAYTVSVARNHPRKAARHMATKQQMLATADALADHARATAARDARLAALCQEAATSLIVGQHELRQTLLAAAAELAGHDTAGDGGGK